MQGGQLKVLNPAIERQNLICILHNPSSEGYKLVAKEICDYPFVVGKSVIIYILILEFLLSFLL